MSVSGQQNFQKLFQPNFSSSYQGALDFNGRGSIIIIGLVDID